jgi:putative Mg2+ transporter-C (MgtC) family protein
MQSIGVGEFAIRLLVAMCLGAVVGIDRERHNRGAGFRTMTLISLGSCGFMLIGHEALAQTGNANSADISRIIQGLLAGIGFLCAGTVIHGDTRVKGLTTAAAAWCVSCVGVACGFGLFKIAGILSAGMLFTLIVLRSVERRAFGQHDEREGPPVHTEAKFEEQERAKE